MDIKKEAALQAYCAAFGNVTDTCQAIGISRQTFYEWLRTDEEFKGAIDSAEPDEVFVDFAENALISRIKEKDTTAIIFALKSKGKKRGYVERQELTGKDGQAITGINYIVPDGGNTVKHSSNGKAVGSLAATNGQNH
jgi:transposase-like protein